MTGRGRSADAAPGLHPSIVAAAAGELPGWSRVSAGRRGHLERVAGLLSDWAREREERQADVLRWTAAGYLHDALRDARPDELRRDVPEDHRGLPGPILHGPAAAARLRDEGVDDPELLAAIRFHTLGHPDWGALGRALYCADFLDPGRSVRAERREALRRRMPGELDAVTREVLAERIRYLVDRARPLFPETVRFWNRLVEEASE